MPIAGFAKFTQWITYVSIWMVAICTETDNVMGWNPKLSRKCDRGVNHGPDVNWTEWRDTKAASKLHDWQGMFLFTMYIILKFSTFITKISLKFTIYSRSHTSPHERTKFLIIYFRDTVMMKICGFSKLFSQYHPILLHQITFINIFRCVILYTMGKIATEMWEQRYSILQTVSCITREHIFHTKKLLKAVPAKILNAKILKAKIQKSQNPL